MVFLYFDWSSSCYNSASIHIQQEFGTCVHANILFVNGHVVLYGVAVFGTASHCLHSVSITELNHARHGYGMSA